MTIKIITVGGQILSNQGEFLYPFLLQTLCLNKQILNRPTP